MPPRLSPAAVVAALGLTQIIGYGTTYYAFARLAEGAAAQFGWPVSWMFGVFSLALVVGGAVAPWAGRRMDRRGAASVMVLGSALSGVALIGMALAPGPLAFAAALIVLQAGAPLMLYDAAFTALVQSGGADAQRRIMHLTLIAGFASTIFWPLTAWLADGVDWRVVTGLYAGLNLVVALPIHAVLARQRPVAPAAPERAGTPVAPDKETRAPALDLALDPARLARLSLLATAGFALASVVLSAVLAQMVPVLQSLGLGAAALLVSTLFGPAQVGVRFVNLVFGAKRHPVTVTIAAVAVLPLAIVILAATAPAVAGAAVFAVLLGFGSGLKSIVQGTLPLALFGGAAYGVRLGRMAFYRQFAGALAPFAFAVLVERFGASGALATLVGIGALAVAAFVAIARLRPADGGGGAV